MSLCCFIHVNEQLHSNFGPEVGKVTWQASLPTVLISQIVQRQTVTAHRHCIDSSAVSVPVHRQSQHTVTVPFTLQLIVSQDFD